MQPLRTSTPTTDDEPSAKKLRTELSANAATPFAPTPIARMKSASGRPASASFPTSPAVLTTKSATFSQQSPSSATMSSSPTFVESPTVQRKPTVPFHQPDVVNKWSEMLTRGMMKHWPGSAEEVKRIMLEIASRIPGTLELASTQVRALKIAFEDSKNAKLRDNVMGGVTEIDTLVRMNERELTNPEEQAKRAAEFQELNKAKDWSELKKSVTETSNMFRCPKCGKFDCRWIQRQTRGGDEPMTIICICNVCEFYWRKRG